MTKTCCLNISGIPYELALLLELLSGDTTGSKINDERVKKNNKIKWDLFIELSSHHRLYPLIYNKAKQFEFPEKVIQALYLKYQKNCFHMLQLGAETEKLAELFRNKNIQVLFLKGPVLAKDLYGDISLRTSSDLDLLIPFHELEKADKYLTELGYKKDDYINTVLNDWKWRHHHFTYYHLIKRTKIEIHWRLNPGPAKEPSFNELWGRKRIIHFSNEAIYILGKEDLFLFLVSHGARHGWSRLRWLADIDRMIRQGFDNKKALSLLKTYHYLHLAGQALLLSKNLFHTPLIEEWMKLATEKRSERLAQQAVFYFERTINLHTEPVPEEVARYHKHHLYALMSKHQKVSFLISTLYPYPIDAETFPLPKSFHFLYFPLHPVLWAYRKLRKQALP